MKTNYEPYILHSNVHAFRVVKPNNFASRLAITSIVLIIIK
jgi:hypothetical protein